MSYPVTNRQLHHNSKEIKQETVCFIYIHLRPSHISTATQLTNNKVAVTTKLSCSPEVIENTKRLNLFDRESKIQMTALYQQAVL